MVVELQPVILAAGRGSRMTDLTSHLPKALLPVGNRPMIWYPMKLLDKSGFTEATVVVLDSQRAQIEQAIINMQDLKLQCTFATIPDTADWGTADSLRYIKDLIKTDLLVVSCDLITDLSLHLLADIHRKHDATVTALFAPSPAMTETAVPGGKSNKKIERDLIALDGKDSQILFMASEADFDENVKIRKSLLKRNPHMRVHSRLLDGHLYIMKKSVVDYLVQEKSITTVKGELMPHLVKSQFNQKKVAPGGAAGENPGPAAIHQEDSLAQLARDYSMWNDHSGDMEGCYHGSSIRCYGYIMMSGFCIRANTIATYCEANRQICRQISSLAPGTELTYVHPSVSKGEKAQVGGESLVAEGTEIKERASIKRSMLGKHCKVGAKVKVSNCVIMDHVNIEEESNLQGCVICDNSIIGRNCVLKDCIVGHSQNINAMGNFTGEVLVDIDRMMEI